MQTLSITQQRIALVVFAILLGAAVMWQGARDSRDHAVLRFSPTPASADASEIDFTSAEAAWRELQIDSQGNLQIDALTESSLLDAMALLNGPRAEVATTRMALLLEKQFGATAAREIMALLPRLQRYKNAEQRWWTENGGSNPPPHAQLFQLQDELLGEALAGKLFSEQRRLMILMVANQRIRNDANLTPAQRDQALIDLQTDAQKRDASVE